MAKLCAFPKAWLEALSVTGSMKLEEWIELSRGLDIDGLEFYAGFLDLRDPRRWPEYRRRVEDQGRSIPMMCCSPDFTHPEPQFRQKQIECEKHWIDATAELGGTYCRILSGQARPGITRADGVRYTAEAIAACRSHAIERGVTLILENHYKDSHWQHPEFAQKLDIFLELLNQIPHGPGFGVNYDPSNCLVCGEDPIEMLEAVKGRVVTMHASDRYLEKKQWMDLQSGSHDSKIGYAPFLKHGVIGRGLNDYERIFQILRGAGFDGWISIENGNDPQTSLEDIRQSTVFLREKMRLHGMLNEK